MREKEETMFRDVGLAVAEGTAQRQTREAADLDLERQGLTHSRRPTELGLRIAPGKEQEFRRLQGWLAVSNRLDRLIEATEPSGSAEEAPVPATIFATSEQSAAAPTGRPSIVGGLADPPP